MISAAGEKNRYVVPLIVGFAPIITLILTWNPAGLEMGAFRTLLKTLALPVVAGELLIIAIALRRGLCRSLRPSSPWGSIAILALFSISVGSALFSAPNPVVAVLRTAIIGIHVLCACAISYLHNKDFFSCAGLMNAIMAGFAAATVALVVFVLQIDKAPGFDWIYGFPGYDNVRRLGYYAAPVAGLSLGSLALEKRIGRQTACFLVSTLALGSIFWSGSRGAMAAFLAAIMIAALLFPALRQLRLLLALAGSFLLGALLAAASASQGEHMGLWRMLKFDMGGAGTSTTGFTSGRAALWEDTIGAVLERPFFGYGEGQTLFVVPMAQANHLVHPHNSALQSLLAWGAVGTGLLLFLALPWAVRLVRKAMTSGEEYLPPLMAMVVIFIHSGVDGTLFHVQSTALFAALAGLAHSGLWRQALSVPDPARGMRAPRNGNRKSQFSSPGSITGNGRGATAIPSSIRLSD